MNMWTCYIQKLLKENKVTIFGKQNPNESYTSKYQEHVAFSHDYKLLCADDKFNKPFKSYLSEGVVCDFKESTVKESKCCSEVTKKHCKKKFVITKNDKDDFKMMLKLEIIVISLGNIEVLLIVIYYYG